jgi:ADP-ribose pyrophosphatase YjhB (NUDIX family)
MIIIASGPVIVEKRKVLLNKSSDTNLWKFCGGKIETFDTDLATTCLREAKEEMGVELELDAREPYLFYTSKQTEKGKADIILVHYLANRKGEITAGSDVREWAWFPIDRLEEKDLAPNIKPALKHFGFLE